MPGEAPVALRHLDYSGRAKQQPYKAKGTGGAGDFALVPRQRAAHAAKLRGELRAAQSESDRLKVLTELAPYAEEIGINLEIRGKPGFPLSVEPFDAAPQSGVALKNVRFEKTSRADGSEVVTTIATVFVRHGKLTFLTKRIEDYVEERQTIIQKGKRAGQVMKLDNETLIANIESIGVAAIEAFWTSRHPLPEIDVQTWWEVWVRVGFEAERARNESAVIAEAQRLGMERRPEWLVLPEHTVFLIKTSRRMLASATAVLNFVSELRHPAVTAKFFIEETPTEQQLWTDDLLSRVEPPPEDAPAVCVLDSGVNRGHPLLADLLAESDQDTVRGEWGKDDHEANGHGTPVAGLAAYGDLTPLLANADPVSLSHRIESVKILPRVGVNEPEHYGPITQAAMAKAESNAPHRARVFVLAVTASDAEDFTENGRPSAWSSALDGYTSGAMEEDEKKRLICVSGGNTDLQDGTDYPSLNEVTSFGDPAQSWNAITVGAYTEKSIVTDENGDLVADSVCLAKSGGLSPSSATTCLWTSTESRQWPLKPDVVFEGGNFAAGGAGVPDAHDSLSLLTTRANFQATLFAPFGDTSAAAPLAARMAAQIQAASRCDAPHGNRWKGSCLCPLRAGRQPRLRDASNHRE
jgi:hypothetical protein